MTRPELDPHYNWVWAPTVDNPDPADPRTYVRGLCKHLDLVPVQSETGQLVARLCTTCDKQFTEQSWLSRGIS